MKKKLTGIVISMLLFATALSVAVPVNAQDWPMFCHNPGRTGLSTSATAPTGILQWIKTLDSPAEPTSPVVVNDHIYLGKGKTIYCVNLSGPGGWNRTYSTTIYSTPAVANGFVYFGVGDKVYCLNADSGNEEWSRQIEAGNINLQPAFVDDFIYIGAKKKMYCFRSDGTEEWNYSTSHGGIIGLYSPAVADGYVYIGTNKQYVYGLNATTGFEEWDYKVPGDFAYYQPTPVVADGKVYFGTGFIYGPGHQDNEIICVDADTGNFIRSKVIGQGISGSPAIAYGKIYFGWGYNLLCLDANSLMERWNFSTCDLVKSSPSVAGGLIYFGTGGGMMYCLDTLTGNEIWNYSIGSNIDCSPAIVDGFLYVTQSNNVYCFGGPNPPDTPKKPDGPTEGEVNVKYTFTANTTDPDEDDISYNFSWGDETYSGWTEFVPSGDEMSVKHQWSESGIYEVKVKARDIYLDESDWSPIHTITIQALPELEIESISGGKGITAVITNTGDGDATDVDWSIQIDSGLFIAQRNATGRISTLPVGESEEVTMSVFGIGLGILTEIPTITVSAVCAEGSSAEDNSTAKIFLSFVKIQEE